MSASVKEEPMLEELEMKSSIKESSSTLKPVEDICTVYVKEEDVKMEGKLYIYKFIISVYVWMSPHPGQTAEGIRPKICIEIHLDPETWLCIIFFRPNCNYHS